MTRSSHHKLTDSDELQDWMRPIGNLAVDQWYPSLGHHALSFISNEEGLPVKWRVQPFNWIKDFCHKTAPGARAFSRQRLAAINNDSHAAREEFLMTTASEESDKKDKTTADNKTKPRSSQIQVAHKAEIDNLVQAHNNHTHDLRDGHANELNKLQHSNQKHVEALNATHSAEIATRDAIISKKDVEIEGKQALMLEKDKRIAVLEQALQEASAFCCISQVKSKIDSLGKETDAASKRANAVDDDARSHLQRVQKLRDDEKRLREKAQEIERMLNPDNNDS